MAWTATEPASAEKDRTAIASDEQRLDAFHRARLHRDQRRAELVDAADASPAVSHAIMERLSAAVRTAEQGVTKAEQSAKGSHRREHPEPSRRALDAPDRLAPRTAWRAQCLSDLERAAPLGSHVNR